MSGDLAAAERSIGRAPEGWQPALGAWMAHLAHRQQRSPNTVAAYLSDVARLAVHAGSEGVDHPAHADRFTIRAWLATLHDGGLAGATIARKLDATKVFYAWAHADGWTDHDPAAGLSMKRPAKPLPRPLTIRQAERLLDSPDPRTPAGLRDLALLDVLYSTGCRAAELVGLDVADVDLDGRWAYVRGKGERERRVPFAPATRDTLAAYLDRARPRLVRADTGALFIAWGSRLSVKTVYYTVAKHADRAGLSAANPSALRHSAATHMLEGGADLMSISRQLGHASVVITAQTYTAVSTAFRRAVYDEAFPR